MPREPFDPSVSLITTFMRRGRFTEALGLMQEQSASSVQIARSSLLADLLQRTGSNQEAQCIALQGLKRSLPAADSARYHWTLGNVARELGNASNALRHFQMAEKLEDDKSELSCWIQLRLMS